MSSKIRKHKMKKTFFLNPPENELFTVWKGFSKNFRPGFSIIPGSHTTLLLYQDGKAVSLSPNETGAIQPFSADPQKKNPFWKPRVANIAEIFCMRNPADINVFWGTTTDHHIVITDETTKKSYNVLLNGVLQLKATNASRMYETLLRNGHKTEQDLQYFLRNLFINNTRAILNKIFTGVRISDGNAPLLSVSCQLELGEQYYEATKDIFKDHGIEMSENTKYTIFKGIVLKPFET